MDSGDLFNTKVKSTTVYKSRIDLDSNNTLLNFTTAPDEVELQSLKRLKIPRDPMSHRIIEKRRRDRMNNCLADLSRLIPTSYLKQGQGRIEKTEIIEMAIKHIKNLQSQVDSLKKQMQNASKTCQEHEEERNDATIKSPSSRTESPSVDVHCTSTSEMLLPLLPSSSAPGILVTASPTRDKHLCSLLTSRALQQLKSEQEQNLNTPVSCNDRVQLSSSPLPNSTVTPVTSPLSFNHFSRSSVGNEGDFINGSGSCENSLNGGMSSGYVSDISYLDMISCASSHNSTKGISGPVLAAPKNTVNIYKFKHNITKRFSQERNVCVQQPHDGSSSGSSKELEELGFMKHRYTKIKNRHASSRDCGPYPASETSLGHVSHHPRNDFHASSSTDSGSSRFCSEITVGKNKDSKSAHCINYCINEERDCCNQSSLPLPGFVLHPSGTHYMPVSICYTNLQNILEPHKEAAAEPSVFHPISIPVHFHGPVISMPNISICTTSHSSSSMDCSIITHKDGDVQHKMWDKI